MKKLVILFIVLAAMISCKKNSDLVQTLNLPKLMNAAITQVFLETDNAKKKIMYQALSEKERYQLWNSKFSELITDQKLNSKQRSFIVNLKNILSVELFTKGSNAQKDFDGQGIKTKAIELFGIEVAFDIVGAIGTSPSNRAPGGWTTDCGCSRRSDWCWNNCIYSACNESGAGCGTLGLYSCVGTCS